MGTYVPYVQLVITGELQLDYPSGSASSAGSAKSFSWAATAATPKTLLGACAAVDVDVSSGANVAAAAASVDAFASAAFYRLTQFGYIPHIVAALALTHSHTLPLPYLPSFLLSSCFSLFRATNSNGCASFQRPFQPTLAAFGCI